MSDEKVSDETKVNSWPEQIQNQEFSNGHLFSFAHIAEGKELMEDQISYIEANNKIQILALTDGMGGHPKADHASAIFHNELVTQLKQSQKKVQLTPLILDVMEIANKKIQELSPNSGATLAVLEIGKGYVRCFHAGDAKIVILGSRGAVKYNSISHSPLGYAIASGAIKEKSDKLPPSNYVSNGLGFSPFSVEVTQKIEITHNDILFISSDYIDDMLKEEELLDFLISDSFEKRASNLIELALKNDDRLFSDDCSFHLFKYLD